ncbi:Vacuolar protein-sorting-associated protein 24 [Entomophthora muscae]|uniref:Vacuolar protein-sorting-associated protein 24 n=1 Tax=Entomophthora muscae TaxID=34485 RepID=A0ACC2RRJ3_9FUNG|nr:Vacuolar protein-sorting-associated protein 24 [Entomophthora muscae]
MMNFFRQPTPEELFKKWRTSIRGQERTIDRQIRGIEAEERKVKLSIKQVAKRNDVKSCRILAKEIVRSRKHKERLHTSKAQLNSVMMQLQHQTAMAKMAGSLQKSAEVMKLVNKLIKLPEISAAMMEMSKELTKIGIIEEMMEDTLEGLDPEDLEDDAEEEVSKVLFEITDGLFGDVQKVQDIPVKSEIKASDKATEQEDEDWEGMQARLSALRS